jgi:signal recognition particle subunit SRP54
MVLNELSAALTSAFGRLARAGSSDDAALTAALKDVTTALLRSDVNVRIVGQLSKHVNDELSKPGARASGVNRARIVELAVVAELKRIVDPGTPAFRPVRGRPNVVLFVGLQGAGKTTTIAKYAHYYASRKWRVAMVCADTFRAGAFDQLKQNATKVRVPFYGSYTEANPAVIAREGVESFREAGYEMIIVDTSGRHKQEAGLFEEMQSIFAGVRPDDVVFVMDGSIGQAAQAQAEAFKAAVPVGSVIITKLDGHAKGGGALSAVAATKSPIIFIGTGEGFDDLALFEANRFVGKLLGKGDLKSLANDFMDKGVAEQQSAVLDRVEESGRYTIRDTRDQISALLGFGNIDKIAEMMPANVAMAISGSSGGGSGADSTARLKRMMNMMDSMTAAELDSECALDQSRARRIVRGSGVRPDEFESMMATHKSFEKMFGGSLMKSSLFKNDEALTRELKRNPAAVREQLQREIDPRMLEQLGGIDTFMALLSDPDMQKLDKATKKKNTSGGGSSAKKK